MTADGFLKEIPGKLKKLPVIHHPEILAVMKPPVLGAVLHTTNPSGRLLTLEEARNDFAGSGPPGEPKFRSAHFMVDRAGVIGQFRSLIQGAAHIDAPWMPRYLGIEHTAHHGENLTEDQKNASADLLSVLRGELNFPLSPLNRPGESGVGVHKQFLPSTGCGEGPFFDKGGLGPEFNEILDRALKRSPIGTWEVRVGDWTWIYSFRAGSDFSSGSVNWRSFDGSKSGTGKWNIRDTATLVIVWPTAQEEWRMPLESSSESGSLVKQLNDSKRDIVKQLEQQGKTRISAHRTD
jgi:N-acetylmuramoyl-L-alanine amidase